MTLIVGIITKDNIVIAGDGLATDMENKALTKRDFLKVLTIEKDINFGFAVNGISYLELMTLTAQARILIDFSNPLSVYDIARQLGSYARTTFANRSKDFSIDMVIGGFDLDERGQRLKTRMFTISTETDYVPKAHVGRKVYYAPITVPDVLAKERIRNDPDYLSRLAFGTLKYFSAPERGIGGRAVAVVVSRDEGSRWVEYQLDG